MEVVATCDLVNKISQITNVVASTTWNYVFECGAVGDGVWFQKNVKSPQKCTTVNNTWHLILTSRLQNLELRSVMFLYSKSVALVGFELALSETSRWESNNHESSQQSFKLKVTVVEQMGNEKRRDWNEAVLQRRACKIKSRVTRPGRWATWIFSPQIRVSNFKMGWFDFILQASPPNIVSLSCGRVVLILFFLKWLNATSKSETSRKIFSNLRCPLIP